MFFILFGGGSFFMIQICDAINLTRGTKFLGGGGGILKGKVTLDRSN